MPNVLCISPHQVRKGSHKARKEMYIENELSD